VNFIALCHAASLKHSDMGGWLHNETSEMNPDTITHPSTNLARCRLTLLLKTNSLPLCQTTACTYYESHLMAAV